MERTSLAPTRRTRRFVFPVRRITTLGTERGRPASGQWKPWQGECRLLVPLGVQTTWEVLTRWEWGTVSYPVTRRVQSHAGGADIPPIGGETFWTTRSEERR